MNTIIEEMYRYMFERKTVRRSREGCMITNCRMCMFLDLYSTDR